jgi:2-iminobutanoate/2-iminopropanoate deaminase
MSHHRHVVEAAGAPTPAGPYSHGVVAGGLLFCSGQIALDPAGELVADGAAEEATICLRNLLEDAVRLTVYLTHLGADAPAVNDVYASFFSEVAGALPARAAVGVSALPRGARVMIDAVVALPD